MSPIVFRQKSVDEALAEYRRDFVEGNLLLVARSVETLFSALKGDDRIKLAREIAAKNNADGAESKSPPLLHNLIKIGIGQPIFRVALLGNNDTGSLANLFRLFQPAEIKELINMRDDQGKSALDVAIEEASDYHMATWLINQGAEIDRGDLELEREPDLYAASQDQPVIAEVDLDDVVAAPPADEDIAAAEDDATAMDDDNYEQQLIAERVIARMIEDRRSYLKSLGRKASAQEDPSEKQRQEQVLAKRVDDGYRFLEFLAEKDQISDHLTVLEKAANYAKEGDPQFLLQLLNIKGIEKFGQDKIDEARRIVEDKLPKQGGAVDRAASGFQMGIEGAVSAHSDLDPSIRSQVARDSATNLQRQTSKITKQLQIAWPQVGQRFDVLRQEIQTVGDGQADRVPDQYIPPRGDDDSDIVLAEKIESDTKTDISSEEGDQEHDPVYEELPRDNTSLPLFNIGDYDIALLSNQLYQIFLKEPNKLMSDKIESAKGFLDIKSRVNQDFLNDSENEDIDEDEAKKIIKQQIVRNAQNPADGTPLVCEMAKLGFADAVEFLLENGALPDAYHAKTIKTGVLFKKTKLQERTLLHDAVSSCDPKTVEVVLKHKPEANIKNGKKGTTPLHIAAREYAEAIDYDNEDHRERANKIVELLINAGHAGDVLENPTKKWGFRTVPGKTARQIIDEANLRWANREQTQRRGRGQRQVETEEGDGDALVGGLHDDRNSHPAQSNPIYGFLPAESEQGLHDDHSLQQAVMSYDEVLQQKTATFNNVAKFIIDPDNITQSNGRELFANFISGFEKIYRCATTQEHHIFDAEVATGVWTGQANGQAITLVDRFLNPIEKLALIAFVKPEGFEQIVNDPYFDNIRGGQDLTQRLLIADNIINSICKENGYLEIMGNLLQPDQVGKIVAWANDRVEEKGGFKEQVEKDYKDQEKIANGNPSLSPKRPAWQNSHKALMKSFQNTL